MSNRLVLVVLALSVGCGELRTDKGKAGAGNSAEAGSQSDAHAGQGGTAAADKAGTGGGSQAGAAAGGNGGGGAGKGGAAGGGRGGASGAGGAVGNAGSGSDSTLPFVAQNVPDSAMMQPSGDLVFNTAGCSNNPEIDTATGMLKGCNGKQDQLNFKYAEITQPDTSLGTLPAALLVTRRFVIEQGMRVSVIGNRPLIIVALDEALISGQLEAAAAGSTANGGGFGPTTDGQNGLGPGGGGKVQSLSGAGGGGFCGKGGAGGPQQGLMSQGGKTYGNPENVPLIGGSSGAKFEWYASAGGGAIQISAGKRIEISLLGVIHVGGGGPGWTSNGGGAGGAILLEAPSVRVLGHLAANGGGGSGSSSADSSYGANGSTDDQPALGGRADTGVNGGDGSAGENIDGKPGAPAPADSTTAKGGGGGGGAGRIRINVRGAKPDLMGAIISPAITTPCFSVGELK
jgi:hypothetical protein